MPTRIRIFHETEYRYSEPVTLGRHKIMVRPRDGHDIRIEASKFDISPSGIVSWHRDELDNSVALVTFDTQPTVSLNITSEVTVAHYLSNRRNLPLLESVVNYPFNYERHEIQLLAAYLSSETDTTTPLFNSWINRLNVRYESTLSLLHRISDAIYTGHRYQAREVEGVQSPEETLRLGSGSCRDYAWLYVVTARHLGIAARFVSGYFHTEGTSLADGTTHAWAEVYLPGAGWTGFDPTSNRLTAENHIPVAVAVNPGDIPPVSGHYTGSTGAWSSMTVRVNVNLC